MKAVVGALAVTTALLVGRLTGVWWPAGLAGVALGGWLWAGDSLERRGALVWVVVPVAMWVATRAPWTPIVSALVLAGALFIVVGRLDTEGDGKHQALGFGLGALVAGVTAAAASYGLGVTGIDGAALAISLVGVRIAAVTLPAWQAGLFGLGATAPWWAGPWSWGLAATEALGLGFMVGPLPADSRIPYAFGGIAAVALVFL